MARFVGIAMIAIALYLARRCFRWVYHGTGLLVFRPGGPPRWVTPGMRFVPPWASVVEEIDTRAVAREVQLLCYSRDALPVSMPVRLELSIADGHRNLPYQAVWDGRAESILHDELSSLVALVPLRELPSNLHRLTPYLVGRLRPRLIDMGIALEGCFLLPPRFHPSVIDAWVANGLVMERRSHQLAEAQTQALVRGVQIQVIGEEWTERARFSASIDDRALRTHELDSYRLAAETGTLAVVSTPSMPETPTVDPPTSRAADPLPRTAALSLVHPTPGRRKAG